MSDQAPAELEAPASNTAPRMTGKGRWGDLGLRAASAVILAPLALAVIWIGGTPWTVALVLLAGGLMLEIQKLFDLHGRRTWPGAALAMLAVLLGGAGLWIAALSVLAIGAALLRGGIAPDRKGPAFGLAYIGLGALSLLWLRGRPEGDWEVLFIILIVWASDIGAYMAGRLIGGPKLAPAISPGKTWSGAAGGLVCAALAGFLIASATGGAAGNAALIAALLSIAGQAGDLLESQLKRRAGVKDSGHLIPGHGGLFDRLDAVIAAAPMAAFFALIAQTGARLWQ